ncbi:MAG: acetate--CoA ligase family protein [Aquisalimonadaceae bacterium]
MNMRTENGSLGRLLSPNGVAIIGASDNPGRIGGQPVAFLSKQGYQGRIYPVNPKYQTVQGLPCFARVGDIDGPADLAVVALPAHAVPQALREAGAAGIPFAVVLSGGFRESGEDGDRLQIELVKAARESGIRVIGPNCQGVVNLHDQMFASFGAINEEPNLRRGPVSMVFQSGGLGFSVLLLCEMLGIGFHHAISIGNQADITTSEVLNGFLDDPDTKIAVAQIEGLSDGRDLMAIGRRAAELGKHLVIWKIGNTEAGARAASSHTANLTGRYDIYRAAFRQAGILEVTSVEEMADLFAALQGDRLPRGRGVAAMGISGGAGILFTDRAVTGGLDMVELSDQTRARLTEILPSFGSAENPVDITANVFNDISQFDDALNVVLADPGVDQLALLLASLPGERARLAAEAIIKAADRHDKPVMLAWSARRERAAEAYAMLEEARIPIAPHPVRTADCMATVARHVSRQAHLAGRPLFPDSAAPAVQSAGTEPRDHGTLDERRSKELMARYGIPVPKEIVLTGEDVGNEALADLRFPVVAKVLSADITHKSDIGGVKLNLQSADEVRQAVVDIRKAVAERCPDAQLEGILVAEMVHGDAELLVGALNDPTFGPVVAVGMGGIFTEVLRDITFRVAPFDADTAREMLEELRGYEIFHGVRGRPALDVEAVVRILVDVSRFAWDYRDTLVELDLNPVLVGARGQGAIAVDAVVGFQAES